jgi:CheY-like chemotaxis protein
MSARILLVEDDPVSQDLLRSVLQAHGYTVDAVGDGFTGLRLLKQQAYALVLVDYHLPELDGYASARLMREAAHGGIAPKLVAVTADRHGLMARSGAEAVFDAILTKPIEPQPLFRLINTLLDVPGERTSAQAAARAFLRDPRHEQARAAAEAFWRDRGLNGRPKALPTPEPTPEQALALSFCFDAAEPDTADLIVLLDRSGLDQLPALHARLSGRPTPVIDVTGHALAAWDAAFRVNDPSSWSAVAGVLQHFEARTAGLTPDARSATDPDMRLLACLYVADRPLHLAYDPSCRSPIGQGGWFAKPEAMLAAERLTARGLLSRQVVERPPGGLEFI